MTKTYKMPEVTDNKITVYNPETGEKQTRKCKSNGILSIFKNLIKYSTANDPNIRFKKSSSEKASEVWYMNENVFSNCEDTDVYTGRYIGGLGGLNGNDLLAKYNTLVEHYTSENSLGGKDIIQEEVCLMAFKLFQWYKDVKQ